MITIVVFQVLIIIIFLYNNNNYYSCTVHVHTNYNCIDWMMYTHYALLAFDCMIVLYNEP